MKIANAWNLFVLSAGLSSLSAGHVYLMESTEAGASSPEQIEMLVDDGKLRMNMPGNKGASVIFDETDKTLTMLDNSRRRYTQLDDEMMSQLEAMMKDVKVQMEQAMARVPASQRAMMEKMMADRMPGAGAPPPEIRIERTGETKKIAGYATEKVVVFEGDQKASEMWVAAEQDVPGTDEYIAAMQGLASHMSRLMESMPVAAAQQSMNSMVRQMGEIQGFPIASDTYQNGRLKTSSLLKSVEEKDLDASLFAPPPKYKQEKIKMPKR